MGTRFHLILTVSAAAGLVVLVYFCFDTKNRVRELTVRGHTQAEWINMLKNATNETMKPLTISQVKTNQLGGLLIELPLSYDALVKHGFLPPRDGKIELKINEKLTGGGYFERSERGNCLLDLPSDYRYLRLGTNRVQVSIWIGGDSNIHQWFQIDGFAKQFVVTNGAVFPVE